MFCNKNEKMLSATKNTSTKVLLILNSVCIGYYLCKFPLPSHLLLKMNGSLVQLH